MTNTLLLKSAIVRQGLTQKQVADELKLSPNGFFKKLHNKSEFRTSEIIKLCDLLNIDKKDEIFFATDVAKLSTKI